MSKLKDITGQRFGLLTALRFVGNSKTRHNSQWEMLCDCGSVVVKERGNLVAGHIKSCGASKHRPKTRQPYKNASKGRHPLFHIWMGMVTRCRNNNDPLYGGRGIKVCDRWRKFRNFVADVGERPPGTSIDRYPNKNGDYEPGNVRWATPTEQANNTRRNRVLTALGRSMTMAEWSRETGLSQDAIEQRLRVLRWSADKALTTPRRGWGPHRPKA